MNSAHINNPDNSRVTQAQTTQSGIDDLYTITPDGTLTYNFHLAQWLAWECPFRTISMIAGTQSGKTVFGPLWLHREILTQGAGDYMAVTTSFPLFINKLLPTLRYFFEDVLGIGRYHDTPQVIEIAHPEKGFLAKKNSDPMYARILLGSAKSLSRLEAATAKAVWQDECGQDAFKIEANEATDRRLSISQGRKLNTTTLYNLGWLVQTQLKPIEATGQILNHTTERGGEITYTYSHALDSAAIQYDSIVNPAFSIQEFEKRRKLLPTHKFNFQYRGRVDQPPGLIYSDFQANRHICKPFPIPDTWRIYGGIDFGRPNLRSLFLAENPDTNQLFIFSEYRPFKTATKKEHINAMLQLTHNRQPHMAGGAPTEEEWREDYKELAFIIHKPPIKDVELGIDIVIEYFKTDRLMIFDTLAGLLSQLNTYSRPVNERGEVQNGIKDKSKYHILDALRYIIAWHRENASTLTDPTRELHTLLAPPPEEDVLPQIQSIYL